MGDVKEEGGGASPLTQEQQAHVMMLKAMLDKFFIIEPPPTMRVARTVLQELRRDIDIMLVLIESQLGK
jgi:hypothetical protein